MSSRFVFVLCLLFVGCNNLIEGSKGQNSNKSGSDLGVPLQAYPVGVQPAIPVYYAQSIDVADDEVNISRASDNKSGGHIAREYGTDFPINEVREERSCFRSMAGWCSERLSSCPTPRFPRSSCPKPSCPRPSCPRVDTDNVKGCAAVTSCLAFFVVMPTLLGVYLPTYTQHVKNYTTYDILTNCVGSSNTFRANAHGRLHCSSKPDKGVNALCGSVYWHDTIKDGCATGHDMKIANKNHECVWGLTVTPCKRDCSSESENCSGTGSNRHCTKHTKYYDNTLTWTLNCPPPSNTTASADANVTAPKYLRYSRNQWEQLASEKSNGLADARREK